MAGAVGAGLRAPSPNLCHCSWISQRVCIGPQVRINVTALVLQFWTDLRPGNIEKCADQTWGMTAKRRRARALIKGPKDPCHAAVEPVVPVA